MEISQNFKKNYNQQMAMERVEYNYFFLLQSSVHDLLVGAMSARVRSRSRGRGDGQETPDVFAFVAVSTFQYLISIGRNVFF